MKVIEDQIEKWQRRGYDRSTSAALFFCESFELVSNSLQARIEYRDLRIGLRSGDIPAAEFKSRLESIHAKEQKHNSELTKHRLQSQLYELQRSA